MVTRFDSQHDFSIRYDGEALREGRMDIRDLAPALLSFGTLFERSNRVLNGSQTEVNLQVQATERGSFEIILTLGQFLVAGAAVLSGDFVTGALNLKTLIVGGQNAGIGLLELIRLLRGQSPTVTEVPGGFRLRASNLDLQIPPELFRLLSDNFVRSAAAETIAPLKKNGIDLFEVRENSQPIVTVRKDEQPYFESVESDGDRITDNTYQMAFQIDRMSFTDSRRWRLVSGDFQISAVIRDEQFWNRVHNRLISFTDGDTLLCEVRTRQWQRNNGQIDTEHEVLRVLRHIQSGSQAVLIELDDDED